MATDAETEANKALFIPPNSLSKNIAAATPAAAPNISAA